MTCVGVGKETGSVATMQDVSNDELKCDAQIAKSRRLNALQIKEKKLATGRFGG